MNTFNAPTTQINAIDKMTTVKCKSVDLEGYVIIVVQTKDNKIKLYGSPSAGNWENLELADEIMDVNETRLEDMTRTEVLSHIHEFPLTHFWPPFPPTLEELRVKWRKLTLPEQEN